MTEENTKRILLVDDEVDLCKVAAWDFEYAGFKVTQANSGQEALELLQKEEFDVLISDIKMPNGDGIDLVKKIKLMDIKLKAIYLMTGFISESESILFSLGVTQLFQKPIDTEIIIKLLNEL